MQFMSMRYPHQETIKELGIEEDVNDILYYIELGDFTKQALPAYREPAIEFLASLKLKSILREQLLSSREMGSATSPSPTGTRYLLSMKELETIYNLEEDRGLDTECV
ncbi:unnamed protein product [Microthlaspi erraticum]|uniref:Arabidopsis retrotransposon Orf1 C-terminal domain-containing protein n=1 Tax=Microthlaspi erraticum TaxID=1685480 RepID=A0A6D2J5Z6_9BRAS|nr:unnamed protein product [Microthlaspi erraticum]